MRSSQARRVLGLLLGSVAVCFLPPAATGQTKVQTVAPATALPHAILTEEQVQRVPGLAIEQLLATRFSGVLVSRTAGGGLSVRIHGIGSFLSSNEALFVIDDVPMDVSNGATLRAINPRDIASIEVIKDPAGLAMYGVRGSNGVIVIRTKRR